MKTYVVKPKVGAHIEIEASRMEEAAQTVFDENKAIQSVKVVLGQESAEFVRGADGRAVEVRPGSS